MIQTSHTLLFDQMMDASSQVDFDDVWDAAGYATAIFAAAGEIGLHFSPGARQTYEGIQTARLAKEWIWNVRSRIGGMTPADALSILEPYDFMHRLGHRAPAPPSLEEEYVLRALDARILGDRSVDQYHLFRKIAAMASGDRGPGLRRARQWASERLARWHSLFRHGVTFEDLPDRDVLETVSILMTQDLALFIDGDQAEYKRKLYDCHRHHLDRVGDYDFGELTALSHFLAASRRHMSSEEYAARDLAIIRAQIARPETNRFYRRTLRRALP